MNHYDKIIIYFFSRFNDNVVRNIPINTLSIYLIMC